MEILSEALIKNQTITTLDLEGNGLGDGKTENMKILSEELMKNQIMTTLDLMDNGFGDGKAENMKILSEALKKNQTIMKLDLREYEFGNTGGITNLQNLLNKNLSIDDFNELSSKMEILI